MPELDALRSEIDQLTRRLQDARKVAMDTSMTQATTAVAGLPRTQFKVRRVLRGHLAKIYALEWSHDNRQLVSASQDGKLIIWDGYTANKVHAIPLRSSWVMSCAYSPSGQCVASGGLDNACTVYTMQKDTTWRLGKELNGHTGYLSDCHFLNDAQILTSSGDKTCALWDIEHGQQLSVFRAHSKDVVALSVVQDQRVFVSGSCDTTAKLWDIRTGRCQQSFAGHESDINAVMHFPQASLAFATGSEDSSCRLFDIRADQEIAQYVQPDACHGVTSIAFSRSGRLLISGCDNYKVNCWDVLLQQPVGAMQSHENRVSCLGVTRDGYGLATGSWDNFLKIWA